VHAAGPKSSRDARMCPGSSPRTCEPGRPSCGSDWAADARATSELSSRDEAAGCG
jgi:hypothetical protein